MISKAARLSGAACATLAALAASPAAATFTKVTTGDIVTIPAWYWNGCWGDYDNDGWLDLFVGSDDRSTTNYLYHNNHDGTFTLIDQAAMPKEPSKQHGCAWGDYDNDGHLDLIVTGGAGTFHNMLYHNNGDGTFSWVTDGPIYTETNVHGFHGPSWADYDNDGFLDLFIAGHDVLNRLFHNQGDGTFTRITTNTIVNDPGDSECRGFVDYDNDGNLDLFVGNTDSHPNFLYRGDGHGNFTSVTDSGLSNAEGTWACAWADYDNDGWPDLLLANGPNKNSLYHNNRDGTFTNVTESTGLMEATSPNDNFSAVAWGDYDNDGFIDLFVATGNCYPDPNNCVLRPNLLYHNEGDGTFKKVTEGPVVNDLVTQCPGASWGDYDNDGFLDLFVSQGSAWPTPQTNLLYHNDGNANAWLNVKLVGTRSNRSAIGAKVRVKAFYRGASRWQLRAVSGGDSQSNQQPLSAEFGLADATIIDTVRVEWPSGIVQELHSVTPRQFLTITEPPTQPEAVCDVNNDGIVNRVDIQLIANARGTPAVGPNDPRDADHDGMITVLDDRLCTLQCTYELCASTPPSQTQGCGMLGAEPACAVALLLWLRQRNQRQFSSRVTTTQIH